MEALVVAGRISTENEMNVTVHLWTNATSAVEVGKMPTTNGYEVIITGMQVCDAVVDTCEANTVYDGQHCKSYSTAIYAEFADCSGISDTYPDCVLDYYKFSTFSHLSTCTVWGSVLLKDNTTQTDNDFESDTAQTDNDFESDTYDGTTQPDKDYAGSSGTHPLPRINHGLVITAVVAIVIAGM